MSNLYNVKSNLKYHFTYKETEKCNHAQGEKLTIKSHLRIGPIVQLAKTSKKM